jgi:hypothetical protein
MQTTGAHHSRRSGRLGTVVAMTVLALLLAPAVASAHQKATPLAFGQWTAFNAGPAGTFNRHGLFRFTSTTRVILRVADGYCRGDRYRVFDHGDPRFRTTKVAVDTDCGRQPFATTGPEGWSDAGYSRGQMVLGPGAHRIRIRSLRSPFGGSTGFVEILHVD